MDVSPCLTGNSSCWEGCLAFQGFIPYLPETSAETIPMCFLWELHLLGCPPRQQLIPGILLSAAAFPKGQRANPSFSAQQLCTKVMVGWKSHPQQGSPCSTRVVISRSTFPQISLCKTGQANLTAVSLHWPTPDAKSVFLTSLHIRSCLITVNGKYIELFNNQFRWHVKTTINHLTMCNN